MTDVMSDRTAARRCACCSDPACFLRVHASQAQTVPRTGAEATAVRIRGYTRFYAPPASALKLAHTHTPRRARSECTHECEDRAVGRRCRVGVAVRIPKPALLRNPSILFPPRSRSLSLSGLVARFARSFTLILSRWQWQDVFSLRAVSRGEREKTRCEDSVGLHK